MARINEIAKELSARYPVVQLYLEQYQGVPTDRDKKVYYELEELRSLLVQEINRWRMASNKNGPEILSLWEGSEKDLSILQTKDCNQFIPVQKAFGAFLNGNKKAEPKISQEILDTRAVFPSRATA